jgi:hypothetical protein
VRAPENLDRRRFSHPSGAPAGLTRFAHPSERQFAALLDLYDISWAYEPVVFPLEWNDSGAVTSAFRPDFWLPDYKCFVELTTAEQRHVTRKNAKLRCMRALYPEVAVTIVYRRDFAALLEHHGLSFDTASAA